MKGRRVVVALGLAATLALAAPASGYVPLTIAVDGGPTLALWSADAFPVALTVSPGLSSDLPGSGELTALTAAMDTWSSAPGSAVQLTLAGEAPLQAGVIDGVNGIEFSNDPALDAQSAVTTTFLLLDDAGRIIEADMRVNDRRFGFNTDGDAVGLDLETLMLRELGTLLGLDSSPIGAVDRSTGDVDEDSSVMFPVLRGPGEVARLLRDDDVAAIAALYPSGGSRGSINGRITRGGSAVFGAHVIAFDPRTRVLVGALSLPDGTYSVGGLPPGRYLLRVQPLSSPAGPTTLGGIFAEQIASINVSFRATFLARAVDVVAGAQVVGVDVEVQ